MSVNFSGNNKSIILSSGLLACSVILFVMALAYFDSHAAGIINKQQSGQGLIIICAIPFLIVTTFLYRIFVAKSAPSRRLVLSVIVGIPVSLLTMITLLSFLHQ